MGRQVVNDKVKLDANIKNVENILKQLSETDIQLKSVMNDLKNNWKDSTFEGNRAEFSKICKDFDQKKASLKKTLTSVKIVSQKIDSYLKI